MIESSLQVTYLHGRAIAAYYYLPRGAKAVCSRTREVGPGLLVDYDRKGNGIGIEILEPEAISLVKMNRILRELGQPVLKRADLAPLRAA